MFRRLFLLLQDIYALFYQQLVDILKPNSAFCFARLYFRQDTHTHSYTHPHTLTRSIRRRKLDALYIFTLMYLLPNSAFVLQFLMLYCTIQYCCRFAFDTLLLFYTEITFAAIQNSQNKMRLFTTMRR